VNVTFVRIGSFASTQVERTLVISAVTSIADWSRLVTGSNTVMSPVAAGTATVGHAVRIAEMPPVASISPLEAQPPRASARIEAARMGAFTGTRTFSNERKGLRNRTGPCHRAP
jgi:hypothetical protein